MNCRGIDLNEILFCDGCEEYFETTENFASTIRQLANDPDVTHPAVLCDDCTLKAMVAEQAQEDDCFLDYICYRCGNNLEVGVDPADGICWHCRSDERNEEFRVS